jgi:glutamyl-tRNA synthetase
VGKSAAVFNLEKLQWLNGVYLRQEKPETLAGLLLPILEQKGLKPRSPGWLVEVVRTLQERSKTLVEMAEAAEFYFRSDFAMDEKAVKKHLTAAIKEPVQMLMAKLESSPELDEKGLEEIFKEIIAVKEIKLGALAQAVRVSLTGRAVSPGIYEVLKIVGKEEALRRIRSAIEKI